MPTLSKAVSKRETLNIRIKPEERSFIDRAARIRGKNRTDFILDAVRAYATLGEIVAVMKDVFGGYEEPTWV